MRARLSKKYDTSDKDYGGRRINPGMRLTSTSAALKSTMHGKSMACKRPAASTEIDVEKIVAELLASPLNTQQFHPELMT